LNPLSPSTDDLLSLRLEAEARLLNRINYERADIMPYCGQGIKLARMVELLERLGNPQQRLKIVHVAGTKGKGSASATIASALSAAGMRTGLFTSPHLDAIEERIVFDGNPCSAAEFVKLVAELWPHVLAMDEAAAQQGGSGPTYFEITTAMALLHFAQVQAHAAVLEVGLGGRLDSTNVCQPVVTAITSISFDHTKQLGNTLTEIAREKAGIIKPGIPIVSGVTESEPARVIRSRAAELSAPLIELERDFDYRYHSPDSNHQAAANCDVTHAARADRGQIDFHWQRTAEREIWPAVELNLLGEHQGRNAAVALAVLCELRRAGWNLPEAAIRQGIRTTVLAARMEVVSRRPTVIVDTAHNVASIRAFVATLQSCFPPIRRTFLFGTTKDKDAAGMLAELLPACDEIVFTRYLNNPRGVPPQELHELATAILATSSNEKLAPTCHCFERPEEAWAWVQSRTTAEQLIGITGSFFFAAEMRRLLRTEAQ
jgi:dihydrofolate synthase/folylpolyglutamate synthase